MKLWKLTPNGGDKAEGAWSPWYDKAFGFVVRAEDENEARVIADSNAGAENETWGTDKVHPWLDPRQSTCEELLPDGPSGLILQDFHAA